MHPAVAELVLVREAIAMASAADDGDFRLVEQVEILVEKLVAEVHVVAVVVDRERVQMRVRPTHRGLEDVMELGQADATGDEKPTPGRGRHLVELDPQLEHHLARRAGHPCSLRSGHEPGE